MQQRPPAYGGYPVNEGALNNGLGHAPPPQKVEMKPPMPPAGGPPPRPMPMAAAAATGYANGAYVQPGSTYGGQPSARPPTQTTTVPPVYPQSAYPAPMSPPATVHSSSAPVVGIVHPHPSYYPTQAQAQASQPVPTGGIPMAVPPRPMMQQYSEAPAASIPSAPAPAPIHAAPILPASPPPSSLPPHIQPSQPARPPPMPQSVSHQHYVQQSVVPPSAPNASAHNPRPSGITSSILPPTGIERLTSQMQNLSTAPTGTATAAAAIASVATVAGTSMAPSIVASQSQPVGIIGQQLPVGEIRKAPVSPIHPILDPAYTRITLNKIPRTAAVLYKTKLPLGITVNPYATLESREGERQGQGQGQGQEQGEGTTTAPPLIDGPIVRCRRCRTYLNPYVQLLDQGMKWKCNLCFLDNEFPPNYDYDTVTQKYIERSQRAELTHPVYEFVAPMEYMVRPPQPPVYLFILDVTYNAVATGLVATASRLITGVLDSIPNAQGRTRVGLMTVDNTIHFYQVPVTSEGDPKMLVVSDLEDPFLPSPEDLLVGLAEGRTGLERALHKISTLFANTQVNSSALGPALSAAIKLLGPVGGKIVVLQTTLPTLGEGKLQGRDDVRLYGTSKESGLLQPVTSYYKTLATECQRLQVCVDLFCFPCPYLDLATLGCVARFTGGHIYLYEAWDGSSQEAVERLAGDLTDLLSMEIGLEAVIRIRASQGLSLGSYHGSFFLRSSDLLSLPNVNHQHAYTAQVTIEENITSQLACFQTAVLHTTCGGERRIRVLNAAYPVTDDPRELFAHADVGALGDVLLKMAAEKVWSHRLEDARDALLNKITDILGAIKAVYQTGQNPQLLLPENLRLLPLLLLAILKSPPIRAGSNLTPDVRSYYLALVKTLPVSESLALLHPFMFALHNLPDVCGLPDEQGRTVMPPAMRLGSEMLERHGFYVLDNGQEMFIWLGSQVHPELLQLIFGTNGMPAAGLISLPVLENAWSKRLAAILTALRQGHARWNGASLWLTGEELGDPRCRERFLQHLIEDKGPDVQPSYSTWAAMLRDKIYATGR